VIPAVGRGLQQRLFKAALDELAISSASRSTACWRSISTVMTSL
jgi:hypothetical protein